MFSSSAHFSGGVGFLSDLGLARGYVSPCIHPVYPVFLKISKIHSVSMYLFTPDCVCVSQLAAVCISHVGLPRLLGA